MPITDTPLRYPGGKSQLAPLVIDLLDANDLTYGEYVEPFAGGAGLALHLLLNSYVSRIYLNDYDPGIHAFWQSVVHWPEQLCQMINGADVTIEEWHRQRAVVLGADATDPLALGFATLFLNRTNRSGIIKGGVIGGLKQDGDYKLDCRFNKADLVRKIRRIAAHADQIALYNLDANDFLKRVVPKTSKHTLVNLDPPYYCKGPELYTNFYGADDHAELARTVKKLKRPWMVTYDDAPEIRALYCQFPMFSSSLNYSAQDKKVGVELLVLSPTVAPSSTVLGLPQLNEARQAA